MAESIFIRALKKKEQGNPSAARHMAQIPDKPGWDKGYKPYGEEGRGYYYIRKPVVKGTLQKARPKVRPRQVFLQAVDRAFKLLRSSPKVSLEITPEGKYRVIKKGEERKRGANPIRSLKSYEVTTGSLQKLADWADESLRGQRETLHRQLLREYGFPEEVKPKDAKLPVPEEAPEPWMVNEAGQDGSVKEEDKEK